MGEARLKRKRHAAVLEACPTCIYCGGAEPATTIEHMPPIGMFALRDRPRGLEFGACKRCNEGTGAADRVASLLARMYPDAKAASHLAEYGKLLREAENNIPGILSEMDLQQNPGHDGVGLLRVDGPLVSSNMQKFALKFGFALHCEATGCPVPSEGGVAARWFSNVDHIERKFPASVLNLLPAPQTLKQGSKSAKDQFQYSYTCTENQSIGLYMGSFRFSFSIVAFAAPDRRTLLDAKPQTDGFRVYAPGELLSI